MDSFCSRNKILAACLFLGGLSANAANALTVEAELTARAEHTDNSLATPVKPQSEMESAVGAAIVVEHRGDDLKVALDYSGERVFFGQGTQSDQTTIEGNGELVYEQIDKQLFWTLENSRRSLLKDKSSADILSNREDRSVTTLRPDWILRLSEVDRLSLSAYYTDIRYQDSEEQDSERLGAAINWNHSLSAVDSLGVTLKYDDVRFERDIFDYEYYLATINYRASLARLKYTISVGLNESQRNSNDFDGRYFRADFVYSYGANSWSLNLVQELTDTSRGNANDGGSDLNGPTTGLIDIFERTGAEFSYTNDGLCAACTVGLRLMYEGEDYEVLRDDSREYRVGINAGYQWLRNLSIQGEIEWADLSFVHGNPDVDYEERLYKLSLGHTITRDFSASWFVSYEERLFDLSARDYDDLRGGLSLTYRFY